MPVEILCKNFPNEFATYLNYCRRLRFDDKPDYVYLRRLFRDLFFKQRYDVAAGYKFDWTIRIAKNVCKINLSLYCVSFVHVAMVIFVFFVWFCYVQFLCLFLETR